MPSVHITGTDRRWSTVAAVEDGGKWRMFLPFPEHTIREAALVGSDRLVCLSEKAEICLIDWRLDKEIARRHVPRKGSGRIFVTADAEFIVIYNAKQRFDLARHLQTIQVLRATSLETIAEGDALQWPIGQSVGRIVNRGAHQPERGGPGEPIELQIQGNIVEDYAGRLAFLNCDCSPTDSYYGLCRIDPSDWSAHFEPIPNKAGPLSWFSASGRFVIAPHHGVLLAQGGSASENGKAVVEGARRNRGVLELWMTEPPKLDALIVTRGTLPPEWISDVVWEPAETGFWVKFEGNSRRIEFQRVGLDGSLSPVFSFQRFRDKNYPVVQDIVGLADSQRIEVRAFFDSVFIQRDWLNSELPFRLISEDEDGFRQSTWPYPPEAAVKRFLAPFERRLVVVVHEFSEVAIDDALRRLTRDVSDLLPDLLQKDVFELSFKVGKRTMTETAFFARLTQKRIPVASALRELLTTYLIVQPSVVEAKRIFRQIWGPENQGALGPAMLALLRLDPGAHDVFRDYLARRDGEHETYSTDVIMKIYIQDTGWRDRAMIGFGIYFALIRHWDGQLAVAGGLLDEYGLLHSAEGMLDADEFASLIVQEVDQFVANPGLDQGTKEDLYLALQPSLEMTQYGRQVLAVIASRTGLALIRSAEERGLSHAFLQVLRFVERKQ
jgi:hypothetical protein